MKHFLFLLILGAVFRCAGENLVRNGSFEEGAPGASRILPGWSRRTAGGSYSYHSITSFRKSDGRRSARISIPEGKSGDGYFSTDFIRLEPDRNYLISFDALSSGGSASAVVILHDSQKNFAGMGGLRRIKVSRTESWKRHEYHYRTPAGNRDGYLMKLQLTLSGAGEVFYDRVSVQESAAEPVRVEFYPSSLNERNPRLHCIENEYTPLHFYFFSEDRKAEYTLELEVPAAFKPVFSRVVYASETPFAEVRPAEGAPAGRRRYVLDLPAAAVLSMSRFSGDLFTGLSMLWHGAVSDGDRFQWRLLSSGRLVKGGSFILEKLEQFSGRLPEQFRLYSWYEPFLNYITDRDLLKGYLGQFQRNGISGCSLSESREHQLFNQAGLINQRNFWYQAPGGCLTRLLQNPGTQAHWEKLLKNLKEYRNPLLCWNFEPGLKDYYHFCDDCGKAFEAFTGLKTGEGITDGRRLEKMHPEQYLAFRCDQQRQIMERFSAVCRRNGVRSGLNSYSINRRTSMLDLKRRMGDIDEIMKVVDVYQCQIYALPRHLWSSQEDMLSRYPDAYITYTTDERHGGEPYSYSLLTPELIETEILMAAVQGVRNLVLFVGIHPLDGRQIIALRRALDRVAAREKLLAQPARNLVSSGNAQIHWRQFGSGRDMLLAAVCCTEFDRGSTAVQIAAPGVLDVEKNSFIPADGKGRLTLLMNPGEVRFLIPHDGRNIARREKFSVQKSSFVPRSCFSRGTLGVTEYAEGCFSVEGIPGSWRIEAASGALLRSGHSRLKGFFFRDLFRRPAGASWSSDHDAVYEFLGAEADRKGGLVLKFRHMLRHRMLKGLELRKQFAFSPDGRSAEVRITLLNHAPQDQNVAFWQHHCPLVRELPVHFLSGGRSISISTESPVNNDLIPDGGVLKAEGLFELEYSPVPEKYYFWKGSGSAFTCEAFFQEKTLKSGQSADCRTILRLPDGSESQRDEIGKDAQ